MSRKHKSLAKYECPECLDQSRSVQGRAEFCQSLCNNCYFKALKVRFHHFPVEGVTMCVQQDGAESVRVGFALTAPCDQFCRSLGRTISLGRARVSGRLSAIVKNEEARTLLKEMRQFEGQWMRDSGGHPTEMIVRDAISCFLDDHG